MHTVIRSFQTHFPLDYGISKGCHTLLYNYSIFDFENYTVNNKDQMKIPWLLVATL